MGLPTPNAVRQLYAELTEPPVTLTGAQHTYALLRLLAVGDAADVHLATAADDFPGDSDPCYLLKVARIPEGDALLANERQALTALLTSAGDTTYRKYLPALVESFPLRDTFPRRVNVFRYQPGLFTLEQVHEQHPRLDGRHLAWIGKRLLTVLGFAHRQGTAHGAVLPCHVLLDPANHGLQLVGWGHSARLGQPLQTISTRHRAWYPPEVLDRQPASVGTDLFLAARCLVYLAGGDPLRDELPASLPGALQRSLRGCLAERPSMRPNDAWALLDEFDELLHRLYGPPKFHPLTMT